MPAKKQTPEPIMTEVRISHSMGVKCNLGEGTYESADYHVSESETWQVPEGMDDHDVQTFVDGRRAALEEKISDRIFTKYGETSALAGEPE